MSEFINYMPEIIKIQRELISWSLLLVGIWLVMSIYKWSLSNFDRKNFKLVMLPLAIGSFLGTLWFSLLIF